MAFGPSSAHRSASRPIWAFLPTWDQNALTSFRHHADAISTVLPSGLSLDAGARVINHVPASLAALAVTRGVPMQPVLSNYDGGWKPGRADRLVRDAGTRTRAIGALTAAAHAHGWQGVNIDLEGLPARDRLPLVTFVARLRRMLGPGGRVSVDVPAVPSPAYDLSALSRRADAVIVMAYDEHSMPGQAGPIADPAWVRTVVQRSGDRISRGHLVVALPAYSYAWTGHRAPTPLDYSVALTHARNARVLPRWSRSAAAPSFVTGHGRTHAVTWMADAVSLANEMDVLPATSTPVALWHLGGEDPGVWDLLAARDPVTRMNTLPGARPAQTLPPAPQVQVVGTGDMVHAVAGRPGWRTITHDWSSERYRVLPSRWRLERWSGGDHRVAITFDDGPSPDWTPSIMAELTHLGVPATFFLVGRNAASYPGLVRQEVANGFTVGGHTFSHPNLATISDTAARLQLMATTRVIIGITGRDPRLFRAPYAADTAPSGPGEVRPLLIAQGLGMTVTGASVDSQDYRRPGVRAIVHNVLTGLRSGNIILFHDAGGDRSQTVAALPAVVHALRARGFRIVPVSALAGVSPLAVMPRVTGAALWLSRAVAWVAIAWFWLVRWIAVIGIGLLILLSIRAVMLIAFALRNRYRPRALPVGPLAPITVVVPAHNEEAVITRTIESLLAQRGVSLEIVVVDDGSADRTAEVARATGVRVISQVNQGKWAALNEGFREATHGWVVAIDADTILHPEAIQRLVRPLIDSRVGAVAGTAKVGNRHTLVTLWQHIEYVTGFNIDRRAHSEMNAVLVIPGAIGAWRREAVLGVGGYSGRSLAEDCDLTVKIQRAGWSTAFVPDAVAWTEAPESARALCKQRLRWNFGTLQVLWANRDALFRRHAGALGSFTLPFAWLYQIVLSLLAPLIDVLVVVSALTGGLSVVLIWFALATGLEMLCALLAFHMEGESAWPVLAMPLARFVYRQLMYWTVVRSLIAAVRGRRMSWGTLARSGSVRAGSGSRVTS